MKKEKNTQEEVGQSWLSATGAAFAQYLILIIHLAVLFSCGKAGRNEQNVFKYNEVSGISSLDPAFAKSQSVIWA
ncbi:MAG: hypothetical protein GXC73_19545, partial [Chitinophagaceae bacterium]|nr:hypothetical protein [Chitinophagaceae bacterium]